MIGGKGWFQLLYFLLNCLNVFYYVCSRITASDLECEFALQLSALSWGINALASLEGSFLDAFVPVNFLWEILNVVNLLLLLQSTVGVQEQRFVEWLWLIIPVSILCSNDVSMNVCFGLPRSLVKQLGVRLKSTRNSAPSVSLTKGVIEFTISNC